MTPMIMLDVDIGSVVVFIALLASTVPLWLALRPLLLRAARSLHHQGHRAHQVENMRKAAVLKTVRRA